MGEASDTVVGVKLGNQAQITRQTLPNTQQQRHQEPEQGFEQCAARMEIVYNRSQKQKR